LQAQNAELRVQLQAQSAALQAQIQAQNRALQAQIQEQNRALQAQIQEQNRALQNQLQAQIQEQNAALQAQIQEQNEALQAQIQEQNEALQDQLTATFTNLINRASAQSFNSSAVSNNILKVVPSQAGHLPANIWFPTTRSDFDANLSVQRANDLLLFYGIDLPVGPESIVEKRRLLAAELGIRI
jgi:hypothetical protein